MFNKRGQVTIFIIIAILIVASVAGYFLVRNVLLAPTVPANLEPVYTAFLSCLEEDTLTGISILESQGGYIELPEFEPGSTYAPFSSQLDFLGNPIPYWYYVSGNGIVKEQVPSKSEMEEQLGNFIETRITECLLEDYFEKGFGVSIGEPNADVSINLDEVEINLDMDLGIERANDTAVVRNHKVLIKSKLGNLYDSARKIYDYEQETLFLENYGIDTLRLYAPVDGVELTCSPLIWNADDVFEELRIAIEQNTLALRARSTDFSLAEEENKYFVIDLPVEEDVRFLNSRYWSYSYEVNPSDGSMLIAKPVGNQPGMAALGFCYVPYHFVYNVNYPILVQVYSGEEIFQFPLAVVIGGNKPREALDATAISIPDPELCEYMNTPIEVRTYYIYLNPVQSNISFQCFSQSCIIGQTSEQGELNELFPQCANGFVTATAEGYQRTKQYLSTANAGYVDVIMNKLYEKEVNLKVDGNNYNEEAIIMFISNDSSTTLAYPEQKDVELSQGQYEVQVYIYRTSSIRIPETTQEQCMEVPTSGLGGIFGLTQEKCFDLTIPEQTIDNALYGGGIQSYYIAESELETSTTIDINVESLPTPRTIENLQENYLSFENSGFDINFI